MTKDQLEDHSGGVPFKIILNVDPIQPDDLEPDLMESYNNRSSSGGLVGFIREHIGSAKPIQAEFPLFSDGSLYWLFNSDTKEDRIAVLTPGDFMNTGDNPGHTLVVWTQVSPDDASDPSANRVWFSSFTLGNNNTHLDPDAPPQVDLDEDYSEPKTNPLFFTLDRQFTSQFTGSTQYWFVQASPEMSGDVNPDAEVDPIDLIPEIINIPIVPIVTINRVDIGPDVNADMGVSPSDLVNLWDLQHMPINISIEPPPGADMFNTDLDINFKVINP